MKQIDFCGLTFKGLHKKELLAFDDHLKVVVTANAEFIVKAQNNVRFKNIINTNYTTFDGRIPYILAKKKHPDIQFDKISGSDFIYDACQQAKKLNLKVFLLGGYEESNTLAVQKLRELYDIEITGYSPPYASYPFAREHNENILSRISDFKPDILFVGFGAEKQEYWIVDNRSFLEQAGVKLAVGSGGTFEFVAGILHRAPKWIQDMGLEGFYRFIVEPKLFRFKRILTSLKIFLYIKS